MHEEFEELYKEVLEKSKLYNLKNISLNIKFKQLYDDLDIKSINYVSEKISFPKRSYLKRTRRNKIFI